MLQITINEELCIGCGECAADCVHNILKMTDEIPEAIPEKVDSCIGCQHCMAVCPTGAFSFSNLDPQKSISMPANIPSADQMEMLIKSRRTTRQYRQENVDSKTLNHLLEITAYAPTGMNREKVLLTIVNDITTMETLRQKTYTMAQRKNEENDIPEALGWLSDYTSGWQKDKDAIYRQAPHMLIASAPRGIGTPMVDCVIALSYFELQAASMGLGTTWCGLAKVTLTDIVPELLAEFKIPDDHEIGYIMLFGWPTVTYNRTVQRTSDRVKFVQLNND